MLKSQNSIPSKEAELSKKSRAESRKLPGNLELSAFLCTFAHDNSNL